MAKIPKFKNEEEAAEFWATHDSTDYIYDMKPLDVELTEELKERITSRQRSITLQLSREIVDAAKKIARRRGISYRIQIQHWVERAVKEESLLTN